MAKKGLGSKILIGANSIAELTSIGGLDMSADTIDVTNLDSPGYREFIQGLKDGGEVGISGFFNEADTNGQIAVYNAFDSGALTAFTILFPPAMGASWAFNAIVTGFKTDIPFDDKIPFEAKLKISGKPTLGLTASAGLSALALTAAGGALSPVFANSTYYYTFGGVTAANVTITATGAGQTIKLFVDGVYSADLTSGSASAAIALALNVGKKLTILANETGKTQKTYEVIVVKTA